MFINLFSFCFDVLLRAVHKLNIALEKGWGFLIFFEFGHTKASFIHIRFSIRSHVDLSLVIPNKKALEYWSN